MVAAEDPGRPDGTKETDLKGIEARIGALRDARRPPPRKESKYSGASLAWRMVLELVVGMMIGLSVGWGLDFLFGSLPVFLAIFGILGFAAGIRTMMRSADEVNRRNAARAAEDEAAKSG